MTDEAFDELFGQLEEKVQAAAEEIERLRGENRRLEEAEKELRETGDGLRADNERLTAEVTELRERGDAGADSEEAGWEAERREIRGRVERIRDRLEELLEDDDG